MIEPFRDGLRAHSYIEGRNVPIAKRSAADRMVVALPTRYRLIIHRKAANARGVTIPPSLRTNQVIE